MAKWCVGVPTKQLGPVYAKEIVMMSDKREKNEKK